MPFQATVFTIESTTLQGGKAHELTSCIKPLMLQAIQIASFHQHKALPIAFTERKLGRWFEDAPPDR